MPRLILASASPRRQELLAQIGVRYQLAPQNIDESPRDGESPVELVRRLAEEKARAALAENAGPDIVVLGSDTIVVYDGVILGKPSNRQDALRMLALLSGSSHEVHTAVSICSSDQQSTLLCTTEVRFRPISDAEAAAYWDSGEPEGKAGGYAIQGLAAVFVESIAGSYSGVMGLPLFETAQLLQQFGIDSWQHLDLHQSQA